MCAYFRESHPNVKCCFKTYWRQIKKKNISFSKLGEQECEVCNAHLLHECSGGFDGENSTNESSGDRTKRITPDLCEVCDDWLGHMEKATESRKEYRKDADTFPGDGVFYVFTDMEKVNMLPRLPGIKTAIFTRRIIMYHETFAPLVPSKETKKQWKERKLMRNVKPLGMIWHEGIQGRMDEDVASTVIKCLHRPQYRDANEMIIWAVKCTRQLKNWSFYCALLHEVNLHPNIEAITLKYFEKGHTLMSADSFHATVEKAMRAKKRLYDFVDFEGCVSKHGIAVAMAADDFYDFKNHLNQGKDTSYPYCSDVRDFQVQKGSTKMQWKSKHDAINFQSGEFVTKKFRAKVKSFEDIPKKPGPRGVTKVKSFEDIPKKPGPRGVTKVKSFEDIPKKPGPRGVTKVKSFEDIPKKPGPRGVTKVKSFEDIPKKPGPRGVTKVKSFEDIPKKPGPRGVTKVKSFEDIPKKPGPRGVTKVKSFEDIPKKPGPRGVTTSKVEKIVVKISPLIPKEQMKFWHQLIRTKEQMKFWHQLIRTKEQMKFWHQLMRTKEQMKFWHQLIRNENSKDLTVNYEHFERTGKKNNESVVEDNVRPASLRNSWN